VDERWAIVTAWSAQRHFVVIFLSA